MLTRGLESRPLSRWDCGGLTLSCVLASQIADYGFLEIR